ncbi:MAG: glutathione S-transferase family protein [Alphaproteobacteria bacterium]
MTTITLVIGNKAYSSWSLRGWLMLTATGADFDEIVVPLDRPETQAEILVHSAAGRVPVLKVDGLTVWDSLAIGECLAERFPAAGLWPADATARAIGRAVSAEMHAGFAALRRHLPMDLKRAPSAGAEAARAGVDIDRIGALWRDCRARFGAGGPFLFGQFGIADAMYAPVATRMVTYAVPLDPICGGYVEAVTALPAMRRWTAAARAEPWVIADP